jgi:hypothetical protein
MASMAMSTKLPPIARRRVKGSIPYANENRAANTTSIINITATLVVEIRACDQVWITKAIAVAKTAVKITTAHT